MLVLERQQESVVDPGITAVSDDDPEVGELVHHGLETKRMCQAAKNGPRGPRTAHSASPAGRPVLHMRRKPGTQPPRHRCQSPAARVSLRAAQAEVFDRVAQTFCGVGLVGSTDANPINPGLVGNEPGQRLIADDHAAVGGSAVEREQSSVVDPAILEFWNRKLSRGVGFP